MVEAMTLGVPCAVSGYVGRSLDMGPSGTALVLADDPTGAAAALATLLADRDRLAALRLAAARYAATSFTADTVAAGPPGPLRSRRRCNPSSGRGATAVNWGRGASATRPGGRPMMGDRYYLAGAVGSVTLLASAFACSDLTERVSWLETGALTDDAGGTSTSSARRRTTTTLMSATKVPPPTTTQPPPATTAPPVAALPPAPPSPDGASGPSPTAAGALGWQLVAADEFDGASVDTGRWQIYDGEGNGGVGLRRPAAVTQADGQLHITGRGDVSGGMNWQGGQTYGRWEFRARSDRGSGYAPAILLWPTSGDWPVDGEIDVMEIGRGDRQESTFTLHWGADNSQTQFRSAADFTQWHTFAVEWTADHITYYLDGVPQYTNTDPPAIPHGPMHLAVQNDVGPYNDAIPPRDADTPAEVALHVDWVRIYR
jgi:beta-glucanase (GH16 family)